MKVSIKNDFTTEDIFSILVRLGVSPDSIDMTESMLKVPTICHNPINEEASKKLYYYDETKLFRCYTECSESFDIFELIIKFNRVNYGIETNLNDAIRLATNVIGLDSFSEEDLSIDTKFLTKFRPKSFYSTLTPYNINVLQTFIKYYPIEWLEEGISKEMMDRFNISYQFNSEKIVMPHYDKNGNLIGIRGRSLSELDLRFKRKYMPIIVGNTEYAHSINLNLYGIHENRQDIREHGVCFLFEGEFRPYLFFQ